MKIILFNGYDVWGGGEKWNFEVAQKILSAGHEVVFIGPAIGELFKRFDKLKTTHPNLDTLEFPITDKTYLNLVKQMVFWQLLNQINADAFVFNSYRDVRALGWAVGRSHIKKRILRVGTPHAPKNKWSYRLTFKNGINIFVGISEDCIEAFRKTVPEFLEGKTIAKITNGIKLDEFVPVKKEIGETFIFGNCCRLTDQKGLSLFLQAMKILVDQGHKVKAIIAGDGEDKEKLLKERGELGLDSIVEFTGHIEKTAEFYPQIDALLFTSYFEGTARTILESYACARPVIAFKASSMAEMVNDVVDGYFAEAFSVDDLAKKAALMIADKKKVLEMGQAGRAKVEREFSSDATYAEWVKLITT